MSDTTATSSRPVSRMHDTGFPDSFAFSTTSRRHPDANTSPGACITSEDIDASRTLNRSRRSFMGPKHKRTISYGIITPEMERQRQLQNHSPTALASIDSAIDVNEGKALVANGSIGRSSKDGTESLLRAEGSLLGDESPVTPVSTSIEQRPGHVRSRSGIFKKWGSK